MDYGQNIKKVRNRLGYTQKELAKKLKVSQVTISSCETNARTASAPFVSKLLALVHRSNLQLDVKYEDFRAE